MRKKRKVIEFTVRWVAKVPAKTDIGGLMIDVGYDGKISMYENGGVRKVKFSLETCNISRQKTIPSRLHLGTLIRI